MSFLGALDHRAEGLLEVANIRVKVKEVLPALKAGFLHAGRHAQPAEPFHALAGALRCTRRMRDSEVSRDVVHGADRARMDTVLHVIVVTRAEEMPSQGHVGYLHRDKPGEGKLGISRDIDDTKLVVWELNEDSLVAVASQCSPVSSRGSTPAKHNLADRQLPLVASHTRLVAD